jgi:type I restriction enzyme S subunit
MQRYRVFSGDVLISVMGTVGRAAVVPDNIEPGIINPRLVRYRPNLAKIRSRYLQLAILSPIAQAQLGEGAKGTTMEGLNMGILGRLVLAIPSLDEQDRILSAVASESERLNHAIDVAGRNANLLREFRTRLIADLVSGKLDVREAAARLPGEPPEVESLDEPEDMPEDEGSADDELEAADAA